MQSCRASGGRLRSGAPAEAKGIARVRAGSSRTRAPLKRLDVFTPWDEFAAAAGYATSARLSTVAALMPPPGATTARTSWNPTTG